MIKSRRIVGIELGSESFKMVEASVKGSAIEIYHLEKKKFAYHQNDLKSVYNFLELFLKNSVGQKKDIVLSIVNPEGLELKVEHFEKNISSEKILKELKENIGLQNSIEWIEDFNVVEIKDSNILFYGRCQKLISKALNESIQKTKNNFFALDFSELAIGRVLDFQLGNRKTPSINCVIDIRLKCTRINTYYNGVLLLPREIAFGGQSFTQALCEKTELSFEEAEEFKLKSSGLTEDYFERHQIPNPFVTGLEVNTWNTLENNFNGSQEAGYNPFQESQPLVAAKEEKNKDFKPYDPFSENLDQTDSMSQENLGFHSYQDLSIHSNMVVSETQKQNENLEEKWALLLEELTREIKRSLDYVQSLGFFVDRIFLSGGGSLIKGLDNYIFKSLNIKCQQLNPFEKMNVKLQNLNQKNCMENVQDFTVAIGNILHLIY